ncbi:uncharacterized protein LOC132974367 [Labrus mixtus]|uniref:uncharacterized protein LOC132974367 n=1 Tax=Labrus mixtus TaxID=508554 RepID=UPI0029C06D0D|nr:uncharacterized protein LOC132974367 [Labrus mixtus]
MILCYCVTLLTESLLITFENMRGVRMIYRTGFLKVVFAWLLVLMHGLDAGHAQKELAARVSCMPKAMTALIKGVMEESLKCFDEANGKHLGTWSPGFPELQVNINSSLHGSKVQCSLIFIAQGMEKILEDQKSNLNPEDSRLHKKLRETISRVNMLAVCMKQTLGGECIPAPPLPVMPKHVYERKQWSHTLLKTAKDYLNWLEDKIEVHMSTVKEKKKIKHIDTRAIIKGKYKMRHKVADGTRQDYLEGRGYLL